MITAPSFLAPIKAFAQSLPFNGSNLEWEWVYAVRREDLKKITKAFAAGGFYHLYGNRITWKPAAQNHRYVRLYGDTQGFDISNADMSFSLHVSSKKNKPGSQLRYSIKHYDKVAGDLKKPGRRLEIAGKIYRTDDAYRFTGNERCKTIYELFEKREHHSELYPQFATDTIFDTVHFAIFIDGKSLSFEVKLSPYCSFLSFADEKESLLPFAFARSDQSFKEFLDGREYMSEPFSNLEIEYLGGATHIEMMADGKKILKDYIERIIDRPEFHLEPALLSKALRGYRDLQKRLSKIDPA